MLHNTGIYGFVINPMLPMLIHNYSRLGRWWIINIAHRDVTFPYVNNMFCTPRRSDVSEKWLDFIETFWHLPWCLCFLPQLRFLRHTRSGAKKHGYNFSEDKALDIYSSACGHACIIPNTDATAFIIKQTVTQLKSISKTLAVLQQQMQTLAKMFPEYPIVMQMFGVGPSLSPQFIAEIGNVRSHSISKIGSSSLCRIIFFIMSVILPETFGWTWISVHGQAISWGKTLQSLHDGFC